MTRNVVAAGRAVGDGIASVTGTPVPERREAVDAPDPGNTPYPNLGTFPVRPPRGGQEARAAEVRSLEQQRDAALEFDAKLRAIDPVLDPGARPPEPPAIAAAIEAPTAPAPVAAPVPVVVPPAPAPVAVPAPAPQAVAPVLRPSVAPAPVVVPPPVAPAQVTPPQIAAAPSARATPSTGAIVGSVDFVEGTVQLTAQAKNDLRAAVIAAQSRNGIVRVTPATNMSLSPVDQSLTSRRMAAIAIELETLGLDRSRIVVDQGWLRAARISVEY
ncbi:MAG: hypothetical protein J0H39_11950 [Alphaproteobacteria bacterium]|nr:hypothetical protein [Alphaproteobacteria bacterium]